MWGGVSGWHWTPLLRAGIHARTPWGPGPGCPRGSSSWAPAALEPSPPRTSGMIKLQETLTSTLFTEETGSFRLQKEGARDNLGNREGASHRRGSEPRAMPLPLSCALTPRSGLRSTGHPPPLGPLSPDAKGSPASEAEAKLGDMAPGHRWEHKDNSEVAGRSSTNVLVMQVGKLRPRGPTCPPSVTPGVVTERKSGPWILTPNQSRKDARGGGVPSNTASNPPGVPISRGSLAR